MYRICWLLLHISLKRFVFVVRVGGDVAGFGLMVVCWNDIRKGVSHLHATVNGSGKIEGLVKISLSLRKLGHW